MFLSTVCEYCAYAPLPGFITHCVNKRISVIKDERFAWVVGQGEPPRHLNQLLTTFYGTFGRFSFSLEMFRGREVKARNDDKTTSWNLGTLRDCSHGWFGLGGIRSIKLTRSTNNGTMVVVAEDMAIFSKGAQINVLRSGWEERGMEDKVGGRSGTLNVRTE